MRSIVDPSGTDRKRHAPAETPAARSVGRQRVGQPESPEKNDTDVPPAPGSGSSQPITSERACVSLAVTPLEAFSNGSSDTLLAGGITGSASSDEAGNGASHGRSVCNTIVEKVSVTRVLAYSV